MDILQYNLKGQRLVPTKDKNVVAANSDGYATIFVDHFPVGFEGTAYFRQSWTGSTIVRAMDGDSVPFDEEITTLPDTVNEYVDYKIFVSISATDGNSRMTTNEVTVYVAPNATSETNVAVLPVGAVVINQIAEAATMTYDIGKRHQSVTCALGVDQSGIVTYAYFFTLENGQSKSVNTPNGNMPIVRYNDGVLTIEDQQPSQIGCVVGN